MASGKHKPPKGGGGFAPPVSTTTVQLMTLSQLIPLAANRVKIRRAAWPEEYFFDVDGLHGEGGLIDDYDIRSEDIFAADWHVL